MGKFTIEHHQDFMGRNGDDLFIPTLNKTGYAICSVDEISSRFIDYAKSCGEEDYLLEVGSGFGFTAIQVLQNSSAQLVCNDLSGEHLEKISQVAKLADCHDHLKLIQASFPDDLESDHGVFSSVLVSRVFHFFDGETVDKSIQKINDLLKPGGKAFIVVESPFLRNWQKFIPDFLDRVSKNEKWPGFISDPKKYEKNYSDNLPERMHFFTPEILSRSFEEHGFVIDVAKFLSREDFPEALRLDGRESVGIIATKKE